MAGYQYCGYVRSQDRESQSRTVGSEQMRNKASTWLSGRRMRGPSTSPAPSQGTLKLAVLAHPYFTLNLPGGFDTGPALLLHRSTCLRRCRTILRLAG